MSSFDIIYADLLESLIEENSTSSENSYSIPDNTSTTATITIGQTINGTLDFVGDEDWYELVLQAGDTVEIALSGYDWNGSNGLGPVRDTFLRLFDESGTLITFDDDGGPGLFSAMNYTSVDGGTFYVSADSYNAGGSGDYQLSVEVGVPQTPVDSVEGDNAINDDDTIYVYFAQAGEQVDGYTATHLNSYERAQLFSVFQGVQQFADVQFAVTNNSSQADLTVASANLGSDLFGFFNFPNALGEGGSGVLNDTLGGWSASAGGGLDQGGFAYSVAVHEFGHALGLGHTHDGGAGTVVMQGVSNPSSYGTFDINQTVFSAMSYNDGWQTGPDGMSPSNNYGFIGTFSPIDIAALQNMYGVNTNYHGGGNTYELANSNAASIGYSTIWDTGGIRDIITYSGSRDAVIDLRDATLQYEEGGGGFMSYVDGVFGGLTIANGVVIESGGGGGGDDMMFGNDARNTLTGGNGNDTLSGGLDNDTLFGGNGNDEILGDEGYDRLSGSAGNDTLYGGELRDAIRGGDGVDSIHANEGNDRLYGGAGGDFFVFEEGDSKGNRIFDFEDGIDLIDLSALNISFSDLQIVGWRSDTGTRIKVNGDLHINIANFDRANLSEDDFIF